MQGEPTPGAPSSGASEEGLAPRALREALRTPAFRELIRLHASAPSAREARDTVRTILRESPEVGLELASASPAAVDAVVEAAAALGERLAAVPGPLLDATVDEVLGSLDGARLRQLPSLFGPLVARAVLPLALPALAATAEALAASLSALDGAERAAIVRRLAASVDGGALGRAVNELCRLVIRVREEHPGLAGDRRAATELVAALDLGKVRVAATALSACGRDALVGALNQALADPVTLANLLVALPPLINDQLAVLAAALDKVELPDEVLASALLSALSGLGAEDVGRIVSRVAVVLDKVHDGSRVLGHAEPAFKATASELVDRLAATLDGRAVARAVVVLGEDGGCLLTVLAELLRREPRLLPGLASALLGAGAPVTRGLATLLREVNALPEEAFVEVGRQVAELVEPVQVARLLGEALTFARRYGRANPEAATLAATLEALSQHPELRAALEPEVVGRAITAGLARLNRSIAASPDPRSSYLVRVVAAIDPAELEAAWRALLGAFAGTLLDSAERARAALRPLVQVGWRSVRLAAGGARREPVGSRTWRTS